MKKIIGIIILFLATFIFIPNISARSGCCSHHGGVSNSCSSGRQVCNDGTISPSCTCESYSTYRNTTSIRRTTTKTTTTTRKIVYGCIDSNAINYNYLADLSDGSCRYEQIVKNIMKTKYKIIKLNKKTKKNKYIKVIKKGKKGKKEYTYKVTKDEANNELSKEVINKKVIKKPVNKIIKYIVNKK